MLSSLLTLVGVCSILTSGVSGSKLALPPTDTPGGFQITVNDVAWFSSGNVSVTVEQRTYTTTDGSLKPNGVATTGSGFDKLGDFTSRSQVGLHEILY
jgi:hypothetical protein